MYKGYPFSKTTYYRRKKKAEILGCSIIEVPDTRGKHGNHPRGSKHYRWNRDKIISTDEYVKIRVGKGHPLADPNGYVYEHLLVWISAGGGALFANEVLHHINNDGQDNRLENLKRMTKAQHNALHNKDRERNALGQFI